MYRMDSDFDSDEQKKRRTEPNNNNNKKPLSTLFSFKIISMKMKKKSGNIITVCAKRMQIEWKIK